MCAITHTQCFMLIVKYKVILCSHCLGPVAIGYDCYVAMTMVMLDYMCGLMLGQSLMVTGATVIVLHVKTSPYYNVWHNVTVSMERGMKK